jgi:hypothetical protein
MQLIFKFRISLCFGNCNKGLVKLILPSNYNRYNFEGNKHLLKTSINFGLTGHIRNLIIQRTLKLYRKTGSIFQQSREDNGSSTTDFLEMCYLMMTLEVEICAGF